MKNINTDSKNLAAHFNEIKDARMNEERIIGLVSECLISLAKEFYQNSPLTVQFNINPQRDELSCSITKKVRFNRINN